jgi:hypothetical protein
MDIMTCFIVGGDDDIGSVPSTGGMILVFIVQSVGSAEMLSASFANKPLKMLAAISGDPANLTFSITFRS